MLKIRLKRIGRKNEPCYKLVIVENLSKRDGKVLKEIGFYNPLNKRFFCNKMLLYKYLKYGAYPTDTVRHLIYKSISKKEQ